MKKKKQFSASAALSVKDESWPSSTAGQFHFSRAIIQFHQTAGCCGQLTAHNPSLTLTPQHSRENWAVEPLRNKWIYFKEYKKLWDLELTFLLSSISCSNMALNTGERAESSDMRDIRTTAEMLIFN